MHVWNLKLLAVKFCVNYSHLLRRSAFANQMFKQLRKLSTHLPRIKMSACSLLLVPSHEASTRYVSDVGIEDTQIPVTYLLKNVSGLFSFWVLNTNINEISKLPLQYRLLNCRRYLV